MASNCDNPKWTAEFVEMFAREWLKREILLPASEKEGVSLKKLKHRRCVARREMYEALGLSKYKPWTNIFMAHYRKLLRKKLLALRGLTPEQAFAALPRWMQVFEQHFDEGPKVLKEIQREIPNKNDILLDVLRAMWKELRENGLEGHKLEFWTRAINAASEECGYPRTLVRKTWQSAMKVAMQKLRLLQSYGDRLPTASPAHLSNADWLAVDLLLAVEPTETLLDQESLTDYDQLATLTTLFSLAQMFQLDQCLLGRFLLTFDVEIRWKKVTECYLLRGLSCSIVVLQRRWYELVLLTRSKMTAVKRGAGAVPPICKQLAIRFPELITSPLLSWREMVASKRVVMPDHANAQLTPGVISATQPPPIEYCSNDDDIILIEKDIETIDLDGLDTDDEDKHLIDERIKIDKMTLEQHKKRIKEEIGTKNLEKEGTNQNNNESDTFFVFRSDTNMNSLLEYITDKEIGQSTSNNGQSSIYSSSSKTVSRRNSKNVANYTHIDLTDCTDEVSNKKTGVGALKMEIDEVNNLKTDIDITEHDIIGEGLEPEVNKEINKTMEVNNDNNILCSETNTKSLENIPQNSESLPTGDIFPNLNVFQELDPSNVEAKIIFSDDEDDYSNVPMINASNDIEESVTSKKNIELTQKEVVSNKISVKTDNISHSNSSQTQQDGIINLKNTDSSDFVTRAIQIKTENVVKQKNKDDISNPSLPKKKRVGPKSFLEKREKEKHNKKSQQNHEFLKADIFQKLFSVSEDNNSNPAQAMVAEKNKEISSQKELGSDDEESNLVIVENTEQTEIKKEPNLEKSKTSSLICFEDMENMAADQNPSVEKSTDNNTKVNELSDAIISKETPDVKPDLNRIQTISIPFNARISFEDEVTENEDRKIPIVPMMTDAIEPENTQSITKTIEDRRKTNTSVEGNVIKPENNQSIAKTVEDRRKTITSVEGNIFKPQNNQNIAKTVEDQRKTITSVEGNAIESKNNQSTPKSIEDRRKTTSSVEVNASESNLEEKTRQNSPMDCQRGQDKNINVDPKLHLGAGSPDITFDEDKKLFMTAHVPVYKIDDIWKKHAKENAIAGTQRIRFGLPGLKPDFSPSGCRKPVKRLTKRYRSTDLRSNPDFQISLKRLSVDFVLKHAEMLANICKPITVDIKRMPIEVVEAYLNKQGMSSQLPPRKKVELADIDEVRRKNKRLLTAQVKPIVAAPQNPEPQNASLPTDSHNVDSHEVVDSDSDVSFVMDIGPAPSIPSANATNAANAVDAETNDTLTQQELEEVLNKLTTQSAAESSAKVSQKVPKHCCPARRVIVYNRAKARIAARAGKNVNINIVDVHAKLGCKHASLSCDCCCLNAVRGMQLSNIKLSEGIKTLHIDLKMLWQAKRNEGKHKSPAFVRTGPGGDDGNVSVEKQKSQEKPKKKRESKKKSKGDVNLDENEDEEKSKEKKTAEEEKELKQAAEYEEWMRQRNICAKYFTIDPSRPTATKTATKRPAPTVTFQRIEAIKAKKTCQPQETVEQPTPTIEIKPLLTYEKEKVVINTSTDNVFTAEQIFDILDKRRSNENGTVLESQNKENNDINKTNVTPASITITRNNVSENNKKEISNSVTETSNTAAVPENIDKNGVIDVDDIEMNKYNANIVNKNTQIIEANKNIIQDHSYNKKPADPSGLVIVPKTSQQYDLADEDPMTIILPDVPTPSETTVSAKLDNTQKTAVAIDNLSGDEDKIATSSQNDIPSVTNIPSGPDISNYPTQAKNQVTQVNVPRLIIVGASSDGCGRNITLQPHGDLSLTHQNQIPRPLPQLEINPLTKTTEPVTFIPKPATQHIVSYVGGQPDTPATKYWNNNITQPQIKALIETAKVNPGLKFMKVLHCPNNSETVLATCTAKKDDPQQTTLTVVTQKSYSEKEEAKSSNSEPTGTATTTSEPAFIDLTETEDDSQLNTVTESQPIESVSQVSQLVPTLAAPANQIVQSLSKPDETVNQPNLIAQPSNNPVQDTNQTNQTDNLLGKKVQPYEGQITQTSKIAVPNTEHTIEEQKLLGKKVALNLDLIPKPLKRPVQSTDQTNKINHLVGKQVLSYSDDLSKKTVQNIDQQNDGQKKHIGQQNEGQKKHIDQQNLGQTNKTVHLLSNKGVPVPMVIPLNKMVFITDQRKQTVQYLGKLVQPTDDKVSQPSSSSAQAEQIVKKLSNLDQLKVNKITKPLNKEDQTKETKTSEPVNKQNETIKVQIKNSPDQKSGNQAQLSNIPGKTTGNQVQTLKSPVKPTGNQAQTSNSPVKTTGNHTQTSESLAKTTGNQTQTSEIPANPTENQTPQTDQRSLLLPCVVNQPNQIVQPPNTPVQTIRPANQLLHSFEWPGPIIAKDNPIIKPVIRPIQTVGEANPMAQTVHSTTQIVGQANQNAQPLIIPAQTEVQANQMGQPLIIPAQTEVQANQMTQPLIIPSQTGVQANQIAQPVIIPSQTGVQANQMTQPLIIPSQTGVQANQMTQPLIIPPQAVGPANQTVPLNRPAQTEGLANKMVLPIIIPSQTAGQPSQMVRSIIIPSQTGGQTSQIVSPILNAVQAVAQVNQINGPAQTVGQANQPHQMVRPLILQHQTVSQANSILRPIIIPSRTVGEPAQIIRPIIITPQAGGQSNLTFQSIIKPAQTVAVQPSRFAQPMQTIEQIDKPNSSQVSHIAQPAENTQKQIINLRLNNGPIAAVSKQSTPKTSQIILNNQFLAQDNMDHGTTAYQKFVRAPWTKNAKILNKNMEEKSNDNVTEIEIIDLDKEDRSLPMISDLFENDKSPTKSPATTSDTSDGKLSKDIPDSLRFLYNYTPARIGQKDADGHGRKSVYYQKPTSIEASKSMTKEELAKVRKKKFETRHLSDSLPIFVDDIVAYILASKMPLSSVQILCVNTMKPLLKLRDRYIVVSETIEVHSNHIPSFWTLNPPLGFSQIYFSKYGKSPSKVKRLNIEEEVKKERARKNLNAEENENSRLRVKQFAKTGTDNALTESEMQVESQMNDLPLGKLLVKAEDFMYTDNKCFKKLSDDPLIYAQVFSVRSDLSVIENIALNHTPLYLLDLYKKRLMPIETREEESPDGTTIVSMSCRGATEAMQDLVNMMRSPTDEFGLPRAVKQFVIFRLDGIEDDPSASSSNPCASGNNPCASESNPNTSDNNPCASDSNPCASDSNPCASDSNPCASGSNPCASGSNPCAFESNPSECDDDVVDVTPTVNEVITLSDDEL